VKKYGIIQSIIIIGLVAAVLSIPAQGSETAPSKKDRFETATFAGGCFWCMEEAFDQVDGVLSTTSGYIGGHKKNPTYEQVSAGNTGHTEAIEIQYDPKKVNYAKLLLVFWRNVDPTTPNRQFCDVGSQYRSAIFFHDESQERIALESLTEIERSKPFSEPIVTQINPASAFYKAETYHQDFYQKNPLRYKFYKYSCGRVKRLKALWGKG